MDYEDEKPREIRGIQANLIAFNEIKKRKAPRGIHSERHELIDKMRKDFGETAEKGVGSFGFYLGKLSRVPIGTIFLWLGDIRQSPNLRTPVARCKVFWWKYKQWHKGLKQK